MACPTSGTPDAYRADERLNASHQDDQGCARGDSIDFRVGYANDLASLGRSFDITLCIGLLYHVPEIMGAIQQIGEVTKEMVIVESAIYLDHNELPLVRVADGKGRVPGTWHPNMTALEFMFRKVGFKSTKPLFKSGGRGGNPRVQIGADATMNAFLPESAGQWPTQDKRSPMKRKNAASEIRGGVRAFQFVQRKI